ncbi:MAG: hypothetical protein JO368_00060, partial [Acidimicrobiales bacterium]|nr:hypothetical protein [Acidimicrobiales bacterium]
LGPDLRPVTVSAPARALLPSGGGGAVAEEFVDLGPVPLFGIRCGPEAGGHPPIAVFLTAGVLHRSGPARMWTDLARRWASRGVPSVRVDVSGTGHSGTRPGQPRLVVLAPEALDDLATLAAALGGPDGRDLVYVGLSSGGALAVEAALQQRPLGICALNPSITSRPPEATVPGGRRRGYRRTLFRSLRRRHRRIAGHLAWAAGQVLVHRAPVGPLVLGARRGSSVLTVVTEDEAEPLRGNAFWGALAWPARRAGRYRLCVIPGRDHSLYLRATRVRAMEAMTEWVVALHDRGASSGAS